MKPFIGLIIKERGNFALLKAGYRVRRLYWGPSILSALRKGGFDLVFNVSSLAEAAVLEESGVPYVGSDVFAISAAADKSLAKRLWQQAGLPTAPFAIFRSEQDCEDFLQHPTIPFPLFLKPVAGRGSAGISASSIVGVAERLRDFGRIDLMLTETGPCLLEANTFAGLMCQPRERPRSYIGFMAVAAGLDGPKLLDRLVQEAWQRTVA